MKKNCKNCGKPIHPKRLEIIPTAITCVECSNTGKKSGVTVTKGKGDHTYNEIVIMEPEEYNRYKDFEQGLGKSHFDDEKKSSNKEEDNLDEDTNLDEL